MAEIRPVMSAERAARSREYRRIQYRVQLVSLILSALFLLVMIFGGSLWLWGTRWNRCRRRWAWAALRPRPCRC